MPTSYPTYRKEVRDFILANFSPLSQIVDIGPGEGTYAKLLPEYLLMDCVEVYEPYIERFKLRDLYRVVFTLDVRDFDFRGYDLAIFGDVLEHLNYQDAFTVLARSCPAIVQIPFLYEQGSWEGNDYEAHLQPELTHELFMRRYDSLGFRCLARCDKCGIYTNVV